jgi:hypothetical protein
MTGTCMHVALSTLSTHCDLNESTYLGGQHETHHHDAKHENEYGYPES